LRGVFPARRALIPALLALAAVVTGCGGGGGDKEGFVAPKVDREKTLIRGYAQSAGRAGSYTPTGKIIADSGFRPWVDGFSFENYGNDVGPQNMTAANVENIFGRQVCLKGTGATCVLLPAAKQWMDNQNAAMAGGHCMGFSVTALRFFEKSLKTQAYGADTPPKLEIVGNLPLQEKIAETWAYQGLPLVNNGIVTGAPNKLLDTLTHALQTNNEHYTLGILNATGGHAITPFAIEDNGGGRVHVLVYDNNFPGIIRAIAFNRNTQRWVYHGGPNPKDLDESYTGSARHRAMLLLPTSPGEKLQPCPFCEASALGDQPRGYAVGTVLKKDDQYDEISLVGDPENHAHLLLRDRDGNETGFKDGGYVNEIPGAEIKRSLTIQNWNQAPEPTYRVPVGLQVRVTVDATDLDKPDTENVTLVGPGEYFEINKIKLKPGQKDFITFEAGGRGLNYETNAEIGTPPLIGGGLTRGAGDDLQAYYFIASAVGVQGASSLALIIDEKDGLFGIDTAGTTGDLAGSGIGTYAMTMTRAQADGSTDTWSSPDAGLFLKGGVKGQVAVVRYATDWKRDKDVPVIVRTPGGEQSLQRLKPAN
jgi:hypothetical protein